MPHTCNVLRSMASISAGVKLKSMVVGRCGGEATEEGVEVKVKVKPGVISALSTHTPAGPGLLLLLLLLRVAA